MSGFNKLVGFNKSTGFQALPVTLAGFGGFNVDAGPTPPPPLFMDGVASTGIFALRRTNNNYTGPLIQVRRSNDNALADIGYDSNGVLDQAALLAHTGSNSGFIATWYDQGSNGYNATQGTAANQPRIVNAGAIHTQNSLPAIQFNGSAWRLQCTGTALGMARNVPGFTALSVMQGNNTSVTQGPFTIHAGASSGNGRLALVKNSSNRIQAVCKALDTDTGIFASNAVDNAALTNWVVAADYTAPNCTLYKATASQGNGTTGSTAGNTDNTDSLAIYIGCRGTGTTPNQYWNGHISELILLPYLATQTVRESITNSQTAFYGL